MIKYKATFYGTPTINKVEIVRETDKQVIFENYRECKNNNYFSYSNTFKEAKDWILNRILKDKSSLGTKISKMQEEIKYKDELFSKVYDWEEE